MPSVEEHLAYLEGRVQEHGETLGRTSEAITGVKAEIAALATDLRGEMRALRGEMDAMRTESRGGMGAMRTELRGDIGALRKEMTTGFRWLVGLQGLVVAVVTALAAEFFQ